MYMVTIHRGYPVVFGMIITNYQMVVDKKTKYNQKIF